MNDADKIGTMARLLRCLRVDLGDERAVLRALSAARYTATEIVCLSDAAIEAARIQTAEHGEPQ